MASLSNINGLFDVHSTGAILFSTSHGTSGQILKSNGNAAPTWVAASTVIGGPYLPLTGGTLSGPLAGTSATFSGSLTVTAGAIRLTGANQYYYAATGTNSGLWVEDNFALRFGTNNTERLIISNTGNATFAGIVGMGSTGIYAGTAAQLNLPGRGLAIKNDKNGSNNNWSYIENTATGSASNINFYTGNNAAALTLAHNGDATFTGNVTVSGTSSTFNTGNSGTFVTNDASNYPRFTMTNASAQIGLFRAGGNAGGMYIGGSGDGFRLYTPSFSQKLFIDTNGNATFAGDIELAANLFSTGSNLKFHAAGTHVMNIDVNGKVYPNTHNAYDLGYSTSLAWRNLYLSGTATIPTIASNTNFIGDIYQYGSVFRTSSFINLLNNKNTKKYLETAYFTNVVSNQAVNIQFPNVAMQGYYKITLSGSYSHQDISGKLTKVIPFGYNPNGGIWRTGNNQSEITIATGGVSTNFTIGNLAWDSTNSKFIVPIYKLTNTGNAVKILVEYFGGAADQLTNTTLSSNYTQAAPSPFNVRQYRNIRDRLGIGTNTPATKLEVNGGLIKVVDGGDTAFYGGDYVRVFGTQSYGFRNSAGSAIAQISLTGNSYFNGGNVGIGTTSPDSLLQLESSANPDVELKISNTATVVSGQNFGGSKIRLIADGTNGDGEGALRHALVSETDSYDNWEIRSANSLGTLAFDTLGSERMRITSSGTIFMYGLGGYTSSNADVRYATSSSELYYQTSSKRYKTNIVNLENSLDKINKLRPVRYVDINTEEPACGLIAEETVELIPEVVFTKEIEGFDEPQVEGINYSDIVPFLIKAIQELEAKIKKLENK